MTHMDKAMDQLCPFYVERNNKCNITSLLATICTWQLEGYENPFGLTKVRRDSQSTTNSYNSSSTGRRHVSHTGNFPTQFLTDKAVILLQGSGSSLNLASSSDSLFQHVPDITASQAAVASIIEIQGTSTTLWLLRPAPSHSCSGMLTSLILSLLLSSKNNLAQILTLSSFKNFHKNTFEWLHILISQTVSLLLDCPTIPLGYAYP